MIEHVTDLLGAYLDGELGGLRQRQVEDHLGKCASCRKELAELRHLSTLLQESAAESTVPADRFAANLQLQLSAREGAGQISRRRQTAARRPLEFVWWMVPAGMLAAWGFVQLIFTGASWLSTAALSGLFGNSLAWLQGGSDQTLWFSASMSLFGGQIHGLSQTALDVMNSIAISGANVLLQVLVQAVLAAAYWTWLGLWWRRRRSPAVLALPARPSLS